MSRLTVELKLIGSTAMALVVGAAVAAGALAHASAAHQRGRGSQSKIEGCPIAAPFSPPGREPGGSVLFSNATAAPIDVYSYGDDATLFSIGSAAEVAPGSSLQLSSDVDELFVALDGQGKVSRVGGGDPVAADSRGELIAGWAGGSACVVPRDG